MAYTKDLVTNQMSSATATQIVNEIVTQLAPTHIEVATPMDLAISGETPLSVRGYYNFWANIIHATATGVCHRGTYADFEGLYGKSALVGASRIPAGTSASAATDGQTTWLGRVYEFCTTNASAIQTNDIIGFFPEATGHGIFSDSTSFLPNTGSGVQANFATFFADMHTVVTAVMTSQSKTVNFFPAQNYSELNSGWIPNSVFTDQGVLAFDHYGVTHAVSEMNSDLRAIYATKGGNKAIILCEWGDYWNNTMETYARMNYVKNMYDVYSAVTAEGKMTGFGYWRAAVNNLEGILYQDGSNYRINGRGKLLAAYWKAAAPRRLPVLDASGNY